MNRLLTILPIALLISACCTQKRCLRKFPPHLMDSLVVVKEYRDTIITIPGEAVIIRDTLFCDSLGNIKPVIKVVKSGSVSAVVSIIDNILKVDCKTDSLQLIITKLKESINTASTKVITTVVKKIPGIYYFYKYSLFLLMSVVSLYILLKYKLGWLR